MNSMNRRFFLTGSLSAAALGHPALAQSAPIGTGVIGTGNRGSADLKSVLAQPGVKVNALCDIKPDRLDTAASIAAATRPGRSERRRRGVAVAMNCV